MSKSELGLKRDHKGSVLANASTVYHKQPKKAILDTNEFDVDDYSQTLLQKCNNSREHSANCLLQHFNNDRNSLHMFASHNCKIFNEMNKKDFNNYRFSIFKALPSKNETSSYTDYQFKTEGGIYVTCCRSCFCKIYMLSDYMIKKMKHAPADADINFNTSEGPDEFTAQEFSHWLEEDNINNQEFQFDIIPAAFAPDDPKALRLVAWLRLNFITYGDAQPNSRIMYVAEDFKNEIYDRYCDETDEPVNKNDFYLIWKNCFPFVKVREECNVIGKCDKCATISKLRGSSQTVKKELGKRLKTYHQLLYRAERLGYEERVMHAIACLYIIASFAIDIMDTYKMKTPNLGSQAQSPESFDSIIVGVVTHGSNKTQNDNLRQTMKLFRTWSTIKKTQNIIAHCFLRALQDWINNHGGMYPRIIYLQVDGGCENANHTFLCNLQHCVHLNMADKIVYTRLPSGHGHLQDIDGGFGVVKSILRNKNMAGLNDFKNYVKERLCDENSRIQFTVNDLYLIENWEEYYKPYYSKVERLHRLSQTQHQLLFEAVKRTVDYPTGCKIHYRAYSSPKVTELLDVDPMVAETDLGSKTGLEPVEVFVSWFDKDEENNIVSFLHDVPNSSVDIPILEPRADCFDEIEKVMNFIWETKIASITPQMKQEYVAWRKKFLPTQLEASGRNLESYATRIGFLTPLFHVIKGLTEPQIVAEKIQPKITALIDEVFDDKIKILRALTKPSIRTDRPITRDFIPLSDEANEIRNSIIQHDGYTLFKTYIRDLQRKYLSLFLRRYDQCKIGPLNVLKFKKPANLAEAPQALFESLSDFLYNFYTPILPMFKSIVEKTSLEESNTVVAEIKEFGKVKVKHIFKFSIKTINILMVLFNSREDAIFSKIRKIGYDEEAAEEGQQQRLVPTPVLYRRIKFELLEKVCEIFSSTVLSIQEPLPSATEYSKVIYPYRYEITIDNHVCYIVALIIMHPKEKMLFFLDPYLDIDSATRTLGAIKQSFDYYYNCTFNGRLYYTIDKDNDTDAFEKLSNDTMSEELSIIYMYVLIYYVIFSCPIIFRTIDLKVFQDKIRYMILKKTLVI